MRLSSRRARLAAFVVMTLGTATGAEANETWRGLTVTPEHRCAPYDRGEYPVPADGRGAHRREHGRPDIRPVHRPALRKPPGDGHRAHGRDLRCPRQRAVRGGRRNEAVVRVGPAEPDADRALAEPAPEEREGRRRVAPEEEPLLFAARVAVKRKYGPTVEAREARALGASCRAAPRPGWWWSKDGRARQSRCRGWQGRARWTRCSDGIRTAMTA